MINSRQEVSQGRSMLTLVAWGLGIVCILSGVVDMGSNLTEGFILALIGSVIFPPSWNFIERKTKIKNGWIIRIIVFLVLVVMFSSLSGK